MDVESKIDDLYHLPPREFTAARNALAKTLSGGDAKAVKALAKPTNVPWAINQLYWKSKPVYERLMKSGEALRTAQIAALKGKGADAQRPAAGKTTIARRITESRSAGSETRRRTRARRAGGTARAGTRSRATAQGSRRRAQGGGTRPRARADRRSESTRSLRPGAGKP